MDVHEKEDVGRRDCVPSIYKLLVMLIATLRAEIKIAVYSS